MIEATVNGVTFTIAAQQDATRIFMGTGSLRGEAVTIEFVISGFSGNDACRAVCTRQ